MLEGWMLSPREQLSYRKLQYQISRGFPFSLSIEQMGQSLLDNDLA